MRRESNLAGGASVKQTRTFAASARGRLRPSEGGRRRGARRFPLGVPEIASPDTCGYLGFFLPRAGNRTSLERNHERQRRDQRLHKGACREQQGLNATVPPDLNGEKINDPNAVGRNKAVPNAVGRIKAVPSGTPLQVQIFGCFRRWLNVLSFERAPRCIRIGTIPATVIRIGAFLAILVRIDVILAAITRIDAVFAVLARIVALLAVLGRIVTFIAVPANASCHAC